MKTQLFFLILVPMLIFSFVSCTEENVLSPELTKDYTSDLQKFLDDSYSSYVSKYPSFPGGIALQVLSPNGDYFIHKGMGENITNQIHFRAASNTKTFTASAIMLLYQEGRLNINDKITGLIPGSNKPYIPETDNYAIPYKEEITIWQLLTHRAGVFDITNFEVPEDINVDVPYKGKNYLDYVMESNPEHTFNFDELVGVVAKCQISFFPPGTDYHYSNQGYSLLGKIIERVSGKSYKQFITENFIIPLKLNNTSFPDEGDDQYLPDDYAIGYGMIGSDIKDFSKSNVSCNIAEGNMISTPENLSRFIRSLLRGEAGVNLSLVNNVMMNFQPTSETNAGGYGTGLFYLNNLGYGHNGAHIGYFSYMVSDPMTDFTILIFTNCWNYSEGMESFIEQLKGLEEYSRQIKSIICNN